MKLSRIPFLLALCFLLNKSISAQVVITASGQASPFFNLEQLVNVQLLNAGNESIKGVLQVQMEDNAAKGIFQMQTLPIEMRGGQLLPATAIKWENGLQFGQEHIAKLMARGSGLPTGQYVYCYRFIDMTTKRTVGNLCQESSYQKVQQPRLAYPTNEQKIATHFPILSWHPPMPLFGNQLNYSLRLVALEAHQTPIEAINTNLPLLERYRLKNLSLPYPSTGIRLKNEQAYVWQVTAYWMDSEIGKTEIWTFKLHEEAPLLSENKTEAFRMVKRRLDGAAYEFSQQIYFAYDNRAYDKQLNYTIRSISKGGKSVATKEIINLNPGINQITLDSKKLKLKKNTDYLLEITDSKKNKHFLEFKYAKKK